MVEPRARLPCPAALDGVRLQPGAHSSGAGLARGTRARWLDGVSVSRRRGGTHAGLPCSRIWDGRRAPRVLGGFQPPQGVAPPLPLSVTARCTRSLLAADAPLP